MSDEAATHHREGSEHFQKTAKHHDPTAAAHKEQPIDRGGLPGRANNHDLAIAANQTNRRHNGTL